MKLDNLLTIGQLSSEQIFDLILRALTLKRGWAEGYRPRPLVDKAIALIFDKASTRTRVSFEAAAYQLGGVSFFLSTRDTQIARSEPLKDTARILSRYVQALVVRTYAHETVEELAAYASIPVINALTDRCHPCQVLSDLLTVQEKKGRIENLKYAWIGDGNNMAHSWLEAAQKLKFPLCLACPPGYEPNEDIFEAACKENPQITLVHDPKLAVKGAQVVSTDVWASMGQEEESRQRLLAFKGYMLDQNLLSLADPEAMVLHCLPAHRGEEITAEVLEGSQSAVWDEAENRLHMQKAILEALLAD